MIEKLAKTILNKHKKRDNWFLDEYSVNPYEGCSCNCLYCYIRGSKYGENMEDGLAIKTNALELLEKQLAARAKKNQYGFIALGSATDAYMPLEQRYKLTEKILQLLLKYRFPVFISTKRDLILRDISLLKEIDRQAILPDDLKESLNRGLILSVSISTLDEKITNMLEPGAIPPLERLSLVSKLKREGFLAGINAMPLLPYISDTEKAMEDLIEKAAEYQADYVLAAGLTLFGNGKADSRTLYNRFLEKFYPLLIPQYEKLYGPRFYPPSFYQKEIEEKARRLCKNYGIRNAILA